jgi:hypothetical protein
VYLRSPKPDGHSDGDSDEDGEELARTTFDMYVGSLFETWGEELANDNEYDAVEPADY